MEFSEILMKDDEDRSFLEFKAIVRDDLREIENSWFLLFDAFNFPEFLVCLNGNFVALKVKTIAAEETAEKIVNDIREANGLVFEITRYNWPSVLQTLHSLSDKTNSFNN